MFLLAKQIIIFTITSVSATSQSAVYTPFHIQEDSETCREQKHFILNHTCH